MHIAEKYENPRPSVLTSALMTDGTSHYVYALRDDNTVEKRDVAIGALVFRRQIIQSGLQPGEKVVVGGLNKVVPGAQVNPTVIQP